MTIKFNLKILFWKTYFQILFTNKNKNNKKTKQKTKKKTFSFQIIKAYKSKLCQYVHITTATTMKKERKKIKLNVAHKFGLFFTKHYWLVFTKHCFLETGSLKLKTISQCTVKETDTDRLWAAVAVVATFIFDNFLTLCFFLSFVCYVFGLA